VNDHPVQKILPSLTLSLAPIDLSDQPENQRETLLQSRLKDEALQPFDLSHGPLIRARLWRLAPQDHVLALTLHHIVSDGWSMGVLFRELSALYRGYCTGTPTSLPELPIQYADYSVWQRDWLQGENLDKQLSYWRKQLDGLSNLQLPIDHPRPPVQSYRGSSQSVEISAQLSQALKGLSQREGATLFMTLLASFQVLLCRYSGQQDIPVGTPIAGRVRQETEGLIGFFVNTLVLRTNLPNNPTFKELLRQVRETTLDAYTHQGLPFEKLVEELHPERNPSISPLFQVLFVFQNNADLPLEFQALTVEPIRIDYQVAKFDLSLTITAQGSSLRATLNYNTDLFEASTIRRMLGHFQTLLEGIITNPDQRISELPLLTEAEKHQLLVEWNDTKTDYPKDKFIHQLFEEQAERTPEAVAVVFEDQQVTYRELNHRSNQLAHYLVKLGVGPEVLVAICLERSIDMVVGLLAILKAGGAYVPLDPDFPKERLDFMLQDAQVRLLLTQEKLLSRIDHRTAVCLDSDWSKIATQSTDNPQSNFFTDNLAYVIYTSGSTGWPKVVAIEHRQLSHYLSSIMDRLDLGSQRSFATVSTLSADLGNTVIFASLCAGGALHVLTRDRVTDADGMADYFSRHAVDCLKIVPSHLAALQSASRPEAVLPRKLLILGGEASDIDWVKRLAALAPDCRIVNHYGPTETTIGVMTYAVQKDALPLGLTHLPLGRPLANTQIYILDQHLNPVPIGVPGEIYIGGQGLARGYLNRPELTQEKFVANPFSAEPGARLYKTGDRARYLADGNVEFLGRTDNQVKLRGYRIEPGEIEAALKQHPDLREAVVLARPGANGENQLAAYVVATPERAPLIAGKPRYRLPNGTAVAQLNKNETDYIYQEIFERQAYLRHGITINDGDCIFDVGANIGLFTLFAHQIAPRAKVYCFEPNPAVYEILQANAKLADSAVKLFNCGLADRAGDTTFTFFPGFSLLSGFHADAQAEKQVVKTFMLNQEKTGVAEMTELVEQADAILEKGFAAQTFSAELRTLSSIMEQEGIESIDLLKVNVEKSELDVIKGIKDHDWPKIKQLVVEVDVKENLPTITSLLEKHGYEYVVEQDDLLEGTSLCYVYAIRPAPDRRLLREQAAGTHVQALPASDKPLLSAAELRVFLAAKLPEPMIPSVYWFLDALPLTANGKLDRQSLPALAHSEIDSQDRFEAPRTPIEELLANIWAEVLKLDKVGIHDNFFHLGGHSLLATQVVSRARSKFTIRIPLRDFFEAPTIATLAQRIQPQGENDEHVRGQSITRVARECYKA
ncbi:MAG TPA: amino acid adenylation domain-containing protein, partial [Candidatus Binatia bacterium]|nr:amino acid adenylation domain-containing protein [Candidatus Binatia bacterium]